MESLGLVRGAEPVCWLHGALAAPPVAGLRRTAPGWAGDEREERLEVLLEGAPAVIGAQVAAWNRLLRLAEQWVREGMGEPVYLCITPHAGSEEYRSLVVSGRVTLPDGAPGWPEGRVEAEMRLLRLDAWESAEEWLAVSNASGVDTGSGVVVSNHRDALHENGVDIRGAHVRGSLPGAARLLVSYANGLGDLITGLVGSADLVGAAIRAGQVLEAEAAQGVTPVNSAAASGGQYAARTLGPSAGEALLTWALSADDLLDWEPGELVPFLRFFTAPQVADAVLYWQVTSCGVTWASEHQPLTGTLLQELPAVDLFAGLRGGRFAPVELALMLKTPAAVTLAVDFVQFFPAWRVRRYLARGALTGSGVFEDDRGAVSAQPQGDSARLSAHCGVGQPLELEPGRDQRLLFLHPGGIDQTLRVRLWYRPRWHEV